MSQCRRYYTVIWSGDQVAEDVARTFANADMKKIKVRCWKDIAGCAGENRQSLVETFACQF
jgi:hypothetical protein